MDKKTSTPMLYDLPFVPDRAYVDFLRPRLERVTSLHFSLGLPGVPDARHRAGATTLESLAELLAELTGPAKLALLNAPFNAAPMYHDPGVLVDALDALYRAGQLDGVVFADGYMLRALGKAAPELAGSLQAIPSVNTAIDSPERLDAQLRLIELAGFLPPQKLVPDRRLNRDLDALARLSEHAERVLGHRNLYLLANEGCLSHCPYKPAHHGFTCNSHLHPASGAAHFPIAREFGCVEHFAKHPEEIFRSPFIRPEDAHRFDGLAAGLKVCGRTRGVEVLSTIVDAYMRGSFDGNLLFLLDSLEPLAQSTFIDNASLPDNFAALHTSCTANCGDCDACRALADAHVEHRGPELTRM